MNALAFDSTAPTGFNSDAWQVLHTPTVMLQAGDRMYSVAQHKVAGGLLLVPARRSPGRRRRRLVKMVGA